MISFWSMNMNINIHLWISIFNLFIWISTWFTKIKSMLGLWLRNIDGNSCRHPYLYEGKPFKLSLINSFDSSGECSFRNDTYSFYKLILYSLYIHLWISTSNLFIWISTWFTKFKSMVGFWLRNIDDNSRRHPYLFEAKPLKPAFIKSFDSSDECSFRNDTDSFYKLMLSLLW